MPIGGTAVVVQTFFNVEWSNRPDLYGIKSHRSSTRIKTVFASAIPCRTGGLGHCLEECLCNVAKKMLCRGPRESAALPCCWFWNPICPGCFSFFFYRLNAITICDTNIIPKLHNCVNFSSETAWFSTLDANLDYWEPPYAREGPG